MTNKEFSNLILKNLMDEGYDFSEDYDDIRDMISDIIQTIRDDTTRKIHFLIDQEIN